MSERKLKNCHVEEGRSPDVAISAIFPLSYVRESARQDTVLSGSELDNLSNLPHLNPLLARRGNIMIIYFLSLLLPFTTHATCTPTPDCADMGYIETSCEGDSLKCPFDITKLYCIPCDTSFKYDCTGIGEIGSGASCNGKYIGCKCSDSYELVDGVCICDSSFKYTCSGTGYSSGSGTSCNGKYKSCTCSANYTWNGSICNLSCSSSYKYTCSGTGYTGGSGTSCGGKYTACTCINDGTSCYVWNGSACTKGTCATGSMEPETPGIID